MTHRLERSLDNIPINPAEFFPWLKRTSELAWKSIPLNDNVYGFQIQAGTKWNPGLTTNQIAQYEADIGFPFPEIFKQYLQVMNGTDTDTVNIYARCGEPFRYAPGFYAYPKDLVKVREKIQWIYESCQVTPAEVEEENIPHIMPIVGHRFLVIDRCPTNPVLSMYGDDIIPYSTNLRIFLVDDIFFKSRQDPHLPDNLEVNFWLK
jgi:hypothetical protein